MMKKVFCFIFLLASSIIFSQEDASGCKDHVSFPRMPKTNISECISIFEKTPVQTGENVNEKKLGLKTDIDYTYNGPESSAPTFADIVNYHENIIQKFSGKKTYSGKDLVTFKAQSAIKVIWVQIKDMSNFAVGNYGLIVLECDLEKLASNANEMGDQLLANGRITLRLSFDPGRFDLKPDFQTHLNHLVRALKDHPLINFTIETHPDKNMNNQDGAQKLADQRAKAIFVYLNSKGIGKFRMKAKGNPDPMDNPVTGNNAVEIVKSEN